jgi:probable rRNA maturation factor
MTGASPFAGLSVRYQESGLRVGRRKLEVATLEILEFCRQDEKLGRNGSIDVLYCSEQHIQSLNRDFRAIDESTDVLSFPADAESQKHLPQDQLHLGDLAISLHYVECQAQGNQSSLPKDVALFLVHGYLHLVGFDHGNAVEKKAMFKEQERLLKAIHKTLGSEIDKLSGLTTQQRATL